MLSGFAIGRQGVTSTPVGQQQQQQDEKTKKSYVDYDANVAKQVKDTIIRLVGDVVFHHNGAIIQCDSALRYSDSKMDCFGNVIINQDSTYIYGDKLSYDGMLNVAIVYAPLIKLTNGSETVMYTYALTFNTLTGVGEFSGGGIVQQRDNFMESQSGTFNTNTNDMKLYHDVALRNKDYQIKTDSMKFNLDTEITTFLCRTYIWDSDKDFLTSESGNYDHKSRVYTFTEKGYLMTPDQEVWADSIIYQSLTREAVLRRNVQILDTAQKTVAFGDWAYYNDSIKKAILSRLPSVRTWEEKGDTSYLRADSIFFETHPAGTTKPTEIDSSEMEDVATAEHGFASIDSMLKAAKGIPTIDSLTKPANDSLSVKPTTDSLSIDSLVKPTTDTLSIDSTRVNPPTIIIDSIPASQPVKAVEAEKSPRKERVAKAPKPAKIRARKRKETDKVVENISNDSLVVADTITISHDTLMINESVIDSLGEQPKRNNRVAMLDSLGQPILDSLGKPVMVVSDSLGQPMLDSLGKPITALGIDSTALKADSTQKDTVERLIRAFRRVRTYRKDFQSACDSLVSYSVDSTLSMFGSPILWNENNQITAQQIDAYSKDEKMDWADFIGDPFVTQQVDTSRYNQAKGRSLRAFFKDNEIDMTRFNGNVLNYYYYEDEDREVVGFASIESAELEMYFKKREPTKMKWIGQAEWAIYPIDQIPEKQPQRMEGFRWITEGRATDCHQVCNRTERPSIRAVADSYTKPTFSIETEILAYKTKILEDGSWRDRVDIPIYTADYFVNRNITEP